MATTLRQQQPLSPDCSCAQYANYINNVGNGADGLHNPITSWFWWCWNANSGDTGGIVRRFNRPRIIEPFLFAA